MKIIIENFGPIYKYEFDLEKDFHIIYGKNNIGKSYAISAVYLILKAFKELKEEFDFNDRFLHSEILNILEETNTQNAINNIIKQIIESHGYGNAEITNITRKNIELFFGKLFIQKLQKNFVNTFSEIEKISNRFSKEAFKISIKLELISFFIKIKDSKFVFALENSVQFAIFKGVNSYSFNIKNNNKDKFILRDIPTSQNLLHESAFEMYPVYFKALYRYILDNATQYCEAIFFLPASKSGLYEAMNIFSNVFAKLSQIRHIFHEKIEIPALSVPMSDYFLHLSSIKTSENNDVYNTLAKEIEEDILNAEIIFNDDNKKLEYYNKKTQLRLALSETSSMISEVAPIVAYLKYIINENDRYGNHDVLHWLLNIPIEEEMPKPAQILFIEEPEAHLHPEVQLKLMNIFAKLIQHDVKIVMTTHSNYIFNKTNNLIYSKEMDFNKISNNHFINTEKGSIVSQAEITPTEIGMQDENFVNVSEQLYNERLSLND